MYRAIWRRVPFLISSSADAATCKKPYHSRVSPSCHTHVGTSSAVDGAVPHRPENAAKWGHGSGQPMFSGYNNLEHLRIPQTKVIWIEKGNVIQKALYRREPEELSSTAWALVLSPKAVLVSEAWKIHALIQAPAKQLTLSCNYSLSQY